MLSKYFTEKSVNLDLCFILAVNGKKISSVHSNTSVLNEKQKCRQASRSRRLKYVLQRALGCPILSHLESIRTTSISVTTTATSPSGTYYHPIHMQVLQQLYIILREGHTEEHTASPYLLNICGTWFRQILKTGFKSQI